MIALHLIINNLPIDSGTKLLNCISCSHLYLSYGSCIVDNFALLNDVIQYICGCVTQILIMGFKKLIY